VTDADAAMRALLAEMADDNECCLKDLPSYGPNEDGDFPDCDCWECRDLDTVRLRACDEASLLLDDGEIPF
jgi:hypothetical protein